MIKGTENILKHFDAMDSPYWLIHAKEKSPESCVGKSATIESLGMDASRKTLEETLGRLYPGTRYYITFKKSPTDSRGVITTAYEHDGHAAPAAVSGTGNFYTPESIEGIAERKANELFAKFKLEQEKENLIKENKELKEKFEKEGAGVFEKTISGFLQKNPWVMHGVARHYLGSPAPKPQVGISGFDKTDTLQKPPVKKPAVKNPAAAAKENTSPEVAEFDTAAQDRLEKIVMMWQEADPEFLDVMGKIAELAVKDPEVYNNYKPMILEGLS